MIALWIGMIVLGLGLAIYASRRAVGHASALAAGTRIPPFFIGVTLLAIGTDLPEIANSIVSSVSGHGDLNVGDGVGSTVTQVTLVLAILPLVGGSFVVGRSRVLAPGLLTAGALLGIAALLGDGHFSRSDGIILMLMWVLASAIVWFRNPPGAEPAMPVPSRRKTFHAANTLMSLALVGAGATAAVFGFIEISEEFGVPEFIIAFFAASLGTSLPELVVDITALRQKQRDMAVGDIFGSSLIDSTLAIGIGPAIAP
ncbi:MAG: sodium:calcium antiporter, partial [Acidimicrobiia bacterium]|nr:sodium:calcium antiporter [Acidimicrobiia bacterium]